MEKGFILFSFVFLFLACENKPRTESDDTFYLYKPVTAFPVALRDKINWSAEDMTFHDQESMELTDSLRKRIRIFVEHDPNYIVYKMDKGCFKEELGYDLMTIMDDGYSFTEDDKQAIYEFLCKNTGVYNDIGSHFRFERCPDKKWPY